MPPTQVRLCLCTSWFDACFMEGTGSYIDKILRKEKINPFYFGVIYPTVSSVLKINRTGRAFGQHFFRMEHQKQLIILISIWNSPSVCLPGESDVCIHNLLFSALILEEYALASLALRSGSSLMTLLNTLLLYDKSTQTTKKVPLLTLLLQRLPHVSQRSLPHGQELMHKTTNTNQESINQAKPLASDISELLSEILQPTIEAITCCLEPHFTDVVEAALLAACRGDKTGYWVSTNHLHTASIGHHWLHFLLNDHVQHLSPQWPETEKKSPHVDHFEKLFYCALNQYANFDVAQTIYCSAQLGTVSKLKIRALYWSNQACYAAEKYEFFFMQWRTQHALFLLGLCAWFIFNPQKITTSVALALFSGVFTHCLIPLMQLSFVARIVSLLTDAVTNFLGIIDRGGAKLTSEIVRHTLTCMYSSVLLLLFVGSFYAVWPCTLYQVALCCLFSILTLQLLEFSSIFHDSYGWESIKKLPLSTAPHDTTSNPSSFTRPYDYVIAFICNLGTACALSSPESKKTGSVSASLLV